MPLYYVAAYGGCCSLLKANDIEEAEREARADVGRDNFQYVRPATREDLGWVVAMGGRQFDIYDLEEAFA